MARYSLLKDVKPTFDITQTQYFILLWVGKIALAFKTSVMKFKGHKEKNIKSLEESPDLL